MNFKTFFESDQIEEWYHGTPHNIERFIDDFVGTGTDQEGPGIYFTSNEEDAAGYARKGNDPHMFKVSLNFKKLVPLKGKIPVNECIQLLKWAEDYENKLLNWGSENQNENLKAQKQSLLKEQTPHQAFQSIFVDYYRYSPIEFVRGMVTLGYDGVIVPRGFMNVKHAIVYNPKIIEVIERY